MEKTNRDIKAILVPNTEESVARDDVPFTDVGGRSYDEVKAIMNAQHPYLVKFSDATAKWSKAKSYPKYFAGAYFHNDTEFVVKTTSTDDAVVKEIKTLFGDASSVELAKYSYAELLDKQAQLAKEAQKMTSRCALGSIWRQMLSELRLQRV